MTTVVAWLWQGLAIAALTALALRRMRRVNAATRYAIWWLALVAVALIPIVQILAALPLAPGPHRLADKPVASALVVMPAIADWAIAWALGIWLASILVSWARIAAGLRLLVRLRRQSRSFDAGREARLTMWTSIRRSRRRPELRVTDAACGARALGLGRPMIVVSQRLVGALDDEQLDQIVMHEYAHLARFDDWARLVQAIITSVAGLHPAVRIISRQIDLEREAACDDRVVLRTGATRRYPACLADAAAVSAGVFGAALLPGALGSSSTLRPRVDRLLEPGHHLTPRLAPAACAAGLHD